MSHGGLNIQNNGTRRGLNGPTGPPRQNMPEGRQIATARPKAEALQPGTNTVSQEVGLLSQMDPLRMEPYIRFE